MASPHTQQTPCSSSFTPSPNALVQSNASLHARIAVLEERLVHAQAEKDRAQNAFKYFIEQIAYPSKVTTTEHLDIPTKTQTKDHLNYATKGPISDQLKHSEKAPTSDHLSSSTEVTTNEETARETAVKALSLRIEALEQRVLTTSHDRANLSFSSSTTIAKSDDEAEDLLDLTEAFDAGDLADGQQTVGTNLEVESVATVVQSKPEYIHLFHTSALHGPEYKLRDDELREGELHGEENGEVRGGAATVKSDWIVYESTLKRLPNDTRKDTFKDAPRDATNAESDVRTTSREEGAQESKPDVAPRSPRPEPKTVFKVQEQRPRAANFDRFGIQYRPSTSEGSQRRTAIVYNLPHKTWFAQVTAAIRESGIVSVSLMKMGNISGLERTSAALVEFLSGASATSFVERCSSSPLIISERKSVVKLVPTATYPIPSEIHIGMMTGYLSRFVQIIDAPRSMSTDDIVRGLGRSPDVNSLRIVEYYRDRRGAVVLEFASVSAAKQAMHVIQTKSTYENVTGRFAPEIDSQLEHEAMREEERLRAEMQQGNGYIDLDAAYDRQIVLDYGESPNEAEKRTGLRNDAAADIDGKGIERKGRGFFTAMRDSFYSNCRLNVEELQLQERSRALEASRWAPSMKRPPMRKRQHLDGEAEEGEISE